ncbi:MAG: PLP-dependent aminotransferase family protein [Bacteroidetes bacterium]|nr:PLP-dependent aminotransferase family protein [Bacteroidota bacterium]
MAKSLHIYLQIANNIEQKINSNVLKVGDKLPSLRTVALEKGVSLSTAQQSYFELESRGLIESRPQSGYYVSYSHKHFRNIPQTSQPVIANSTDNIEDLIFTFRNNISKAKVELSTGVPALELLPVAKLNKALVNATRKLSDSGLNYDKSGNGTLKKQIAFRSLMWGGNLKEDDIITTSGSMEAISFCMLALAEKGDTIIMESPVYFGLLHLAKSLGLNVLELPTNPVTGIEIEALKKTLEKKKVKLCILVSNFSNPLGSCMPDENKKAVVKLMEKHNVPLIEDDLFGDLYFGTHRPSCCKTFDESGIVLLCSSFSKTLAPGYRVGWVAPGKFKDKIARIKYYHTLYATSITHEAIGSFLENDRYENHLRKLRQSLHRSSLQFLRCISQYFPDDTKVTNPQGGLHLWLELRKKADTIELYNTAMANKISIAPGRMFSLQNQYNNCLKLSCGLLWNEKVEDALKILGKLAMK